MSRTVSLLLPALLAGFFLLSLVTPGADLAALLREDRELGLAVIQQLRRRSSPNMRRPSGS